MTSKNQVVCAYCKRKMEPIEFRAFQEEGNNWNDVICPECFFEKTGSYNYTLDMLRPDWKPKK